MRKALVMTGLVSLVFLLTSCASTESAPIRVIGVPEDLVSLTGEWSGTFESRATGRSGNITFHLTDNPDGAHGDVMMVPSRTFNHDRDGRPSHYPENQHGMISSGGMLSIEFVRIAGSEINGRIAPYPDPEVPEATLETHFTGRLDGEWIEGTFVTYSDHGVSPRRGTWRVHRKPGV